MLVFIHLVNIMIGLLFWFFSPRGALVLWLLVGAYFGAALPWPQGGSVVYGTSGANSYDNTYRVNRSYMTIFRVNRPYIAM